ncbi:MAG: s-methyl-5-thioribose-1-phosphate isomerase [Clostridia bacterium]|nr:s-methyl-5-thioribose-1-phosphate isomerase [Clostridia bacterium]
MADTFVDEMLPFLLRRDNVARYENGKVYIGNRRKYPFEKTEECCEDADSVAKAITSMVTQGGGQWIAAAYAMAMEARKVEDKASEEIYGFLDGMRVRLCNTRPTNTTLSKRLNEIMGIIKDSSGRKESVEDAIVKWVDKTRDSDYEEFARMGRIGANLIEDGDGILTVCFAEMSFLFALAYAKSDGKDIRVFTPETRPYLQGARLTAPSIHELGIPVQIISDNMPGFLLSQGKIQKYFTAADLVTLDGYVVNKIGTFQNAVCASYHKIPYFAFCREPDSNKADHTSIVIEERNPEELKKICGIPTTVPDIGAYYPAFDITPPHLVAGVITNKGIINPFSLKMYF